MTNSASSIGACLRRRQWLALAGLSGLPAGVHSASGAGVATPDGLQAAPEPGPATPVAVPLMPAHRLRNGLQVVTAPRRGLPLATARLLLRVGQAQDPPERPGVAALLAELLLRGCRHRGQSLGAVAVAHQAAALGGELSSQADDLSLALQITVATPALPAALDLLADLVRQPLLSAREFERSRQQMLDALSVAMADPSALAERVLRRSYWGDAAYGAVLQPAALEAVTVQDVRGFHALHARPERAALVVAGDVQPDQIARWAQAHLGDWAPGRGPLPPPPRLGHGPLPAPLVLLDLPGSGQAAVALAGPFAADGDADEAAGLMAHAVLGGGYSSRLNQAVRIRGGLSYGVISEAQSLARTGWITALARTDHRSADQVLTLMRREVQALRAAPVSAAELSARRAAQVGGFVRSLQTNEGVVALAARELLTGGSLDRLQRHVLALQAVTPEQVQQFAQRHWAPERWRAVVVADLAAAGSSLSTQARPEAWRIPLPQLNLADPRLGAPASASGASSPRS